MHPTPTTRHRHALRWVLSVELAFVVVVGMGLQVARSRADEQWGRVLSRCQEKELLVHDHGLQTAHGVIRAFFDTRGGNMFREWRQGRWFLYPVVLWQERRLFGTSVEARMTGGTPEQVEAMTAIFAAVDVELVVEP